MSANFVSVYSLKENHAHVSAVQKTTLERSDCGLVPEHGLFGSSDWWNAIDEGAIPVHTVEGVISRVYLSGHNDYPEFEIDDGVEKTSWTREVRERKDYRLYRIGTRVKLTYVEQKFKKRLGTAFLPSCFGNLD